MSYDDIRFFGALKSCAFGEALKMDLINSILQVELGWAGS